MNKQLLLRQIIATLENDLALFNAAARAAHAAATHSECQPDNKYDTTALEASYVAQGQANRARDIRLSLEEYRSLTLQTFDAAAPIRLTALVTLEDEAGSQRQLFLGPQAGGLKIVVDETEIMVITPVSPLGRALLGQRVGDEIESCVDAASASFVIIAVS
jgi:transcription elongation GreA/GreB family factor